MKMRIVMLAAVFGLATGPAAWAQDEMEPEGTADTAPLAEDVDASSNVPLAQETAEPEEAAPVAVTPGSVARAQFTTAIDNREPVDQVDSVENDLRTVYFFTELRDMVGQTVVHRWKYNGNVMAEVSFPVGGSRWRVYSSKNLIPEWVGTWEVDVLNANGEVVETKSFTYVQAEAVEEAMEAPATTGEETMPAPDTTTEPPMDSPAGEQPPMDMGE